MVRCLKDDSKPVLALGFGFADSWPKMFTPLDSARFIELFPCYITFTHLFVIEYSGKEPGYLCLRGSPQRTALVLSGS